MTDFVITKQADDNGVVRVLYDESVSVVAKTVIVYKMYKRADRTQPLCEPVEDVSRLDNAPFTLTCCDLSKKIHISKIQPTRHVS